MKVICAGFWKTGTKSLAKALRVLGYRVCDYDDQLFEFEDLWTKFLNGTVTDEEIRKSLEHVDVLIDGPVIAFWEEIHKVFPEAKVILTTRDEESWFKSFKGMVEQQTRYKYALFIVAIVVYLTPAGRRFFGIVMGAIGLCLGSGDAIPPPGSPRLCKLKFRRHNCYVKYTVPKPHLLEYKATDGWGPLCRFLGKEVPPDMPYPHENKLNSISENLGLFKHPGFRQILIQSLIAFAVIVFLFACLVYNLHSLYR